MHDETPRPPDDVIAVFAAHPDAMARLKDTTRQRYLAGKWPRVIDWVLDDPELARAFARLADARKKAASVGEAA